MKLRELIDRLLTLSQGDVHTEETPLSERHIFSTLQSVRNRLIVDQIKKKQKINNSNYSVLPCVELISVPSHECSCLGNLGCDVYRTKYPLPKILTDNSRHLIESVTSVNNGLNIVEASRDSFRYNKGNRYTSNQPKYIYENNYLYFPLKAYTPSVVRIKFLSEDLLSTMMFPSFCNGSVNSSCQPADEMDFSIDGNLIEALLLLSKQELLGEMKSGRPVGNEQPQQNQE